MKKPANIYSIIISVLVLFLVGCIPDPASNFSEEAQTGDKEQANGGSRQFDPMEFQADMVNIPKENPQSGDLRGMVDVISVDSSVTDNYGTVVLDVPNEIDSVNSQAFRVQIFTSKVYGESKKAMRIGEEIFDRPLFLDYEVPYFKVRVGNFPDREKAEDYMVRVKASGYSSAWVVLVNIAVKETAPLYDDEYPELYLDSVLNNESESENSDDGKSPKP